MNSNDEYVNQITLKYLTSIDYQNDVHGVGVSVSDPHNKGDKINKSKHTGSKIYRQKDKKFYKKRISNIIKLLLNDGLDTDNNDTNQPNYPLFPDIKNTFDIFVKSCIDYLKSQDKCDIIQNDYNNFTDIISPTPTPSIMTLEPANNIINNNEMNALMMRTIIKKKNSIDSFVKRTSTRQTATIIPQKKKINLQDPELKTKGLVLSGGTVAKPPKIDTPTPKDKKICENKNNNIYKETIPKLDILSKNDNQEEKNPNEKDFDQKKHKKDKKQKNKKNTLQLFIENNE
jgi:hypothetical protein